MFASKTSDIQMVLPSGVVAVNPVKYHAFLEVMEDKGEEAAMVSAGAMAQSPQGMAATKRCPSLPTL